MVALQIREVSEDLRNRLAAIAQERGQSLQSYLLDVVNDEVRRHDNMAVLERFSRPRYGTRLEVGDVVDTLRAERAARDFGPGFDGPAEP
jgi:antitoxin FitA